MRARHYALAILIGLLAATTAMATDDAIAWSLQTPAGETVNFPDERNGPAVLLFWASWCPYCKALMPHLQTLADEYDGELTIYAINFRDDSDPQAFVDKNGYTFTLLLDGAAVAKQYEIWSTPGVLVFDKNNTQILNLYDVITEVDAELAATEGLSHSEKAARKAPAWAAAIGAAL
ncbi:MAG: TlpA family protein disulfide reductase [Gammaproteobacteria bacterium]|nr:TlpA family protein disulfide reductase [Gammaproteobacteria bacterium]MBT8443786.1 TlpA family protein disulfide reductase [Gammaproteobacteria bacterium]NND37543.1 TlpA family protein disulfide reductase [Gammaproteobacteria bacterium]